MAAAMRTIGRLGRFGYRVASSPVGITTIGSVGAFGVYGQYQGWGECRDFFEHSFITRKNPDPIVDFYSTEEFLQVLGIFPFAIHFILAGVTWREDRENAMDVYGSMLIQFDITEKTVKTDDGKEVVGFFNKRERFVNYVPFSAAFGLPILMWDQTQNYGFQRLKDGSMRVIHQGECFYGPWPVLYAVKLHAMYVVWATEKHINSELFGTEDLEAVEEQRSNVPRMQFEIFTQKLQSQMEGAIADMKQKDQNTQEAEANLASLQKLNKTKSTGGIIVATKKRLQRTSSRIEASDPEAQKAITQALAVVSKVDGGQAAQAALQEMMAAAKKSEKKIAA